MPSAPPQKTFTVRVPGDLYESSRNVAKRRGMSVNALVQESLARLVQEEEDAAFYDSFTLLGQDAEESSVEFAVAAQSEVVNGG